VDLVGRLTIIAALAFHRTTPACSFLKNETARWARVVKVANIKIQ